MANWYNPRRMTDGGRNTYKPPSPRYKAPVKQVPTYNPRTMTDGGSNTYKPPSPRYKASVKQLPTSSNRSWWKESNDEEAKRKEAERRSLEQYNDYLQKTRAARQEAEKQAERDAIYKPNVWNPIAGPIKSPEMQERERLSALRGMNDYMLKDWIIRQPNPSRANEEVRDEFLNLLSEDLPNYLDYTSKVEESKANRESLMGKWFMPKEFYIANAFSDYNEGYFFDRKNQFEADSLFASEINSLYEAINQSGESNRSWAYDQLGNVSGDPKRFSQFLSEARDKGINIPLTFSEQYVASQPTQEQVKADQEADSIQQTYRRAAELFIPAPKGHDPKNPPINSLEWYMKGIREGWIYDPEVPKDLKGGDYTSNYYTTDPNSGNDIRYFYGADPFTGEVGIHPYSRLQRSKDRLMGGNWLLPTLSDTINHEWNSPMSGLPFSNGGTHNYLQNVYRSLIEFKNRNKMGMDNLGNIGEPWQGMKNTSLGTDFQYLPALSLPEDEDMPEEETVWYSGGGGGGGGGGYAYTGSTNPFYYSNPPGGGSGGGLGYGARGYGYTGQYSNPANYYNNQYQSRKGEHFSELARWVI